ncbi:Pseudouridine synthase, RsuA/RluB/C/D/E/F [Sesbania bispinosa]|nr:Pseudouridine synthase, RsuA/RluB/C/D/E/F [Sesbania bispinosa]
MQRLKRNAAFISDKTTLFIGLATATCNECRFGRHYLPICNFCLALNLLLKNGKMKRKREGKVEGMDIVWQTPANPPQPQDYIFRNGNIKCRRGIRYVRPYYFEFIAHVKNRWAGKTIVDLFAEEFKGRPYEYYVSAVKCGRIQVDGEMVPVSYVVKPSQKISHFLHRHEPPVMACDVSILQKEPDVLTICKPASVPVHPCGQYRKNTVVGILQAEHGLEPLFRIQKCLLEPEVLQKLTFLGNRPAHECEIFTTLAGDDGMWLNKMDASNYLQVVYEQEIVCASTAVYCHIGKLNLIVDANIDYNAREGRSTAEVRGSAKGKAASTKFSRISTNGTQSIVLCEPVTGRTHQIRVHLQYSGHPIANDMLYISEQTIDRSIRGSGADRSACISDASMTSNVGEVINECEENSNGDFSIDPMCTNCPNLAPKGYDGDEEGLWLHCIRYSGPGWTYECPYPDWAKLS